MTRRLWESVAERTDLPFDPGAIHRRTERTAGGHISMAIPELDQGWAPGAKLLWHARVLELDHDLPMGTLLVEQLTDTADNGSTRMYGIHDRWSGRSWTWSSYSDAWSQLTSYVPGLALAEAMSGRRDGQLMHDAPGAADNALGGAPRRTPHVYARDLASGAGNCVCGEHLGSWAHTEAAAGIGIPRVMRSGRCPWW